MTPNHRFQQVQRVLEREILALSCSALLASAFDQEVGDIIIVDVTFYKLVVRETTALLKRPPVEARDQ